MKSLSKQIWHTPLNGLIIWDDRSFNYLVKDKVFQDLLFPQEETLEWLQISIEYEAKQYVIKNELGKLSK